MELKSRFLALGIGQFGGNICDLFAQKEYPALAVNTSIQDLSTLKNVMHTYHIPGGEGCSKIRKRSKMIFKANFDGIKAQIDKMIQEDLQTIFIAFSAGGGTGSGAGAVMAYMIAQEYPNINVVVITVLPSKDESPMAYKNSYECFKELDRIDNIGATFVLDNDAFDNKLAINQQFIDYLDEFLNISIKDKSELGNIDMSEINTVLNAPKMAVLTATPAKDNIIAALLNGIKNSIFAPIEDDRKIKYLAASLADATLKAGSTVKELQKALGITLDNFITYNNRQRSILCLSGLSYPATRLESIYQRTKENQTWLQNNSSKIKFHDDLDFFNDEKQPAKVEKKSKADIFDMFDM